MENIGWKFDKSVNVAHLLLLLTLGWGVGTWADDAHDNLDSRMSSVEQMLDHHKAMFDMQQSNTVDEIKELKEVVKELTLEIRSLRGLK